MVNNPLLRPLFAIGGTLRGGRLTGHYIPTFTIQKTNKSKTFIALKWPGYPSLDTYLIRLDPSYLPI